MPEEFTPPAFHARAFDQGEGAPILAALRDLPRRGKLLMGGLSPEQAEALSSWVLAGVAEKLQQKFDRRGRDWSEFADAKCAIANAMARELLQDAPQGVVFNMNMSNIGSVPHAIMVLKLPVQEQGEPVRTQHVLIDPTFAQFMTGDAIGERMTETPERRAIAHALMKKGYTTLDEAGARAYITAFASEAQVAQKVRKAGGSYLEMMCQDDQLSGVGEGRAAIGAFTARYRNGGVTRG